MTDDRVAFYERERSRFDHLLSQLAWTEDCLLQEEPRIQCPLDRGHQFPVRSTHLQRCQLSNEGFSKDYLKERAESEREKQLLHQSDISLTPSALTSILGRALPIKTDIPLNVEQTTVLLTPNERLIVAQTVHHEALRQGIVPAEPRPLSDPHSSRPADSRVSPPSKQLAELRDEKRRRAKYVTRSRKTSFYDSARELIASQMELLDQTQEKPERVKSSKHKHRSSSRKKHKSSRYDSSKHRRRSKKRRTS